jgi:hypothetical protein
MSEYWLDAETWNHNPHLGSVLNQRFKGQKFDSYFGKNSHHTQNHALKIYLRIHLKQVNTQVATDSKRRNFPAKNWTPDEWLNFTTQFERQGRLWNNRFWLIPPKYFTLLDDKSGGRAVRPNVQCFLFTEVTNSPANAHRTINVVNLDSDAIRKNGRNPTSGTFRSNERNMDSLDIKPRANRYEDERGVEHTIENYYTVAHEIGHAIGLKHIGVLKSRPQCTFAISLKKHGITNVSSHLQRGSNAEVCYGEHDSLGLAENIMGLGMKFEEINAEPWLKRAALHTNTRAEDWKVVLAPKSPQPVP